MRKLVLGLMIFSAGVATATTYTLSSVDANGQVTLTSGTYWSGGIAPSDAAAAGHDFEIPNACGFRTPGNTSFTCRSLTIGDVNQQVNLYFKEGNWTFPNDSAGITFVRANFDDWTDGTKTFTINGPVTFSDAFSKTGNGRYAAIFATGKTSADAVVHHFTGKVTAPAATRIENHLNNPSGGRHYGLRFSGDLTEFEGEMVLGNSSRLEIGATTLPGRINAAGTDVVIAPVAGTAGFSVGTFTLAAGTTLETSLNRDTGACQPITVTSLLTADTLTVRVLAETYTAGTSVPERKYAILRFPSAGSTFDVSKVTFASDTVDLDNLVTSVETAGNVTTLYLTHAATLPIVNRVSGGNDLYLEYATTWDDGLSPHGNAEYVSSSSASGNLRLWAANSPYVFPGPRLTIQGGNMIAQCNDITISNMVIQAGAKMLNWHEASKIPASLSPGGIRYHRGNIALEGGELQLQSSKAIHFVFDGDISGSKRLNVCQDTAMTSPLYVEFRGNNTFSELINVWTKDATSFDNGVVVCFREGRNLGGNPASFVFNANLINQYVTYRALASTTLETMNRGISVDGAAFDTPADVTLTVRQKIRYAGDLTKCGAGTLVLNDDHDVTAAAPTLRVTDGFLKVTATNAVTGVALAFTGDAALKVDLEDASVSGSGLRNPALATPFTVATDDGKLHVKIDADPMPTHGRAPICTVSTAAAAALRSVLVVEKPADGFKGVVTERVLEPGTVTFAAEIKIDGMMFILR